MDLQTMKRGERKTLLLDSLADTHFMVEEGARLQVIYIGAEGEKARATFELTGAGAELDFLGMIVGTGSAQFELSTVGRHMAPNTKARFLLQSALFDKSCVDFFGNLIVEPAAQLTDTDLRHRTLLLSDGARAKSVPSLEILADDVKAGHASTIGRVDDELLFYFQSRGVDAQVATQLIVMGFFESQLSMISDEQMRCDVRKKIVQSLPFSYDV
ncbi:SufD family Fe-S cluster assembly protein [Patescibacteria group bacterium]|nr:SufD family Fe-S cluster assembly protein [Patescibacteria group bacterium]MBU1702898.1 SufD family Fe-S cluster assembly protein [Patescibacteria group bacterium]MBU1954063.1 SufD family Fe-S cluster assembly protein [Patescibacteria group bacterium]